MKKSFRVLAILLIVLSFTLAACGEEDDDGFDPTNLDGLYTGNSDWIVNFTTPTEYEEEHDYTVTVIFVGEDTALLHNLNVSLRVNGDPVSLLDLYPGFYRAIIHLSAGETYAISLWLNGASRASTTLSMPRKATATFPTYFIPTDATQFSWTMDGNNQYQVAGVRSTQYVTATEYLLSEYIQSIAVSARSFDVPANSAEFFGWGSSWTLSVEQINYTNVDRVAFLAYQEDRRVWGGIVRTQTPEEIRAHALRLIHILEN